MSPELNRKLDAIREWIQVDANDRGLHGPGQPTLANAFHGDFASSCQSLASANAVGIVTGFFIPHGQPPAAETDGPLGAVFLAQALGRLGVRVVLAIEDFGVPALEAGLTAWGDRLARVVELPRSANDANAYRAAFHRTAGDLSHLLAIERVGPSHTRRSILDHDPASLDDFEQETPPEHRDRCHNMRGIDITANTGPAHWLFENHAHHSAHLVTIGVGDGGNEIGMGKLPWRLVRRDIPRGGLIACRVPTDFLIVCGVSNWGAYGLAAGTWLARGKPLDRDVFNPDRERSVLEAMVRHGPLVDGVSGKAEPTVDGLAFDRYIEPLTRVVAT